MCKLVPTTTLIILHLLSSGIKVLTFTAIQNFHDHLTFAILTDLQPFDGEIFQFFGSVKHRQVGLPLPPILYPTESPALLPCQVLPWLVNDVKAKTLAFEEIRGALGGCAGK